MAGKEVKRVKDVTLSVFESFLKKYEPKSWEDAERAGVDLQETLRKIHTGNAEMSFTVARSLFKSHVRRLIDEANATQVSGIIAGMRDQYGRNFPIKVPILKSNGEHEELTTWDSKIEQGGVKEEIEWPGLAVINIKEVVDDKGRRSLNIISIEKFSPMEPREFAEKINKISRVPAEFTKDDEYTVVVVKGIVDRVTTVPQFGENKEVVGHNCVIEPNAREVPVPHPVFQLQLVATQMEGQIGDTVGRLVFNRFRHAKPMVLIEDIFALCNEAVARYREPSSQVDILQNGLVGRKVLAVGVVTKYNTTHNDKYGERNYVDIGCCCIVDVPGENDYAIDELVKEDAEEQAEEEIEEEKPAKKTTKKPAKAGKSLAEKKQSKVAEVCEKILEYCNTLGVDPGELTVEDVSKYIGGELPKGVLKAALDDAIEKFAGEGEESE